MFSIKFCTREIMIVYSDCWTTCATWIPIRLVDNMNMHMMCIRIMYVYDLMIYWLRFCIVGEMVDCVDTAKCVSVSRSTVMYITIMIYYKWPPWVCCVALPCCLFDLACCFLPSFSSLIKTCIYTYIYKYVICIDVLPSVHKVHVWLNMTLSSPLHSHCSAFGILWSGHRSYRHRLPELQRQ